MSKALAFLIVVVAALAAFYGGYVYGNKDGYTKGHDAGLDDAARIQAEAEDTEVQVDTGYRNPYEDVNLNPFR